MSELAAGFSESIGMSLEMEFEKSELKFSILFVFAFYKPYLTITIAPEDKIYS